MSNNIEPKLNVIFSVTAYDCSHYGDDRSRKFTNGQEAIDYAKSLDPKFGASVRKIITMDPIVVKLYP